MSSPSDAPRRVAGTHTRSGNAMLRTRTALLEAAAACVAHRGVRKTTMSDVIARAGVAKATLYNHFRTKDDLLAALVAAHVDQLVVECTELAAAGLQPALEHAASSLAGSAPARFLATEEPGVLAALAMPAVGPQWEVARAGVEAVLREAGAPSDPVAVEVVLRWLCGHLLAAATADEITLAARVLTGGLGRAPEPVVAAPSYGQVGWPT